MYKGLMLIQMAGVILSGISTKSFGCLKRINIFGAMLSCYKSLEIPQLLNSFFHKIMPTPILTFVFASFFNLPAARSFLYAADVGLLAATKAKCRPLAII